MSLRRLRNMWNGAFESIQIPRRSTPVMLMGTNLIPKAALRILLLLGVNRKA